MSKEKWSSVGIMEGTYEVSNLGRLRRLVSAPNGKRACAAGAVIGGCSIQKRRRVVLSIGGRRHPFLLHQLVAEAFLGPCPLGMSVNHKDGNSLNNAASNLEYLSFYDNIQHAVRNGLHARGEKSGKAKLTAERVREAHKRYRAGESMESIGRRFGVSGYAIRNALYGETWRHLGLPPVERRRGLNFDEDTIRSIRAEYRAGVTQVELCRRYGRSRGCIERLVNRKTWGKV